MYFSISLVLKVYVLLFNCNGSDEIVEYNVFHFIWTHFVYDIEC